MRATLLHDDSHEQWRTWLEATGVNIDQLRHGPVFTDSSMVIQAAREGLGVALARSELCRESIRDGRLVRPFKFVLPSKFAYYLVYPKEYAERPAVVAFRQWIMDEIRFGREATGVGP